MKTETNIPYKYYLEESELPTAWYNVRADMKNKPAPLLNPGTLQPMTAKELDGVFCDELVQQELDDTTAYIPIPDRSANTTGCIVRAPCAVPTGWKKPWAPRPRSTISLRATTPAAATS